MHASRQGIPASHTLRTRVPTIRRCTAKCRTLVHGHQKEGCSHRGRVGDGRAGTQCFLCASGGTHTDSKDQASRIDLAQLLENDVASRVILNDMGVIMDENELDLAEDERTANQAHKKKFAEDVVAAVQSSWGSLRQIVDAKRAEARETQRQWKKKRKVEIVEIGTRIDDTPDVSDLGDMGDPGPTTEQQGLQKQAALCESIDEESRRRRLRTVFVMLSPAWPKTGGTSGEGGLGSPQALTDQQLPPVCPTRLSVPGNRPSFGR